MHWFYISFVGTAPVYDDAMDLPDPSWFDQTARENFERHLLPLADRQLFCLQLGAFAGDATVWMLTNLPEAYIHDVDTWEGSEGLYGEWDLAQVELFYLGRIAVWLGWRLVVSKMDAFAYLRRAELGYDFIYIDADHHAPDVLRDAVMAWPLLKPGGLMAFDDYVWEAPSGDELDSPMPAVDAFCSIYAGQLEIVEDNQQKWIRKT